jgi:hypothetical protein
MMNLICKVSELLLAARLKRRSLFFREEARFAASPLLWEEMQLSQYIFAPTHQLCHLVKLA